MAVQIVGKANPIYANADEMTQEEIREERAFKRLHAMMREAKGRKNLVDQNGMEVLPSAQSQQCRVCEIKERTACCEANCSLFKELVFAWEWGLSPVENRFIPETEREDRMDLIINPCQYCKRARRHLDLRIMQVIPATCSGVRSRKFQEMAR